MASFSHVSQTLEPLRAARPSLESRVGAAFRRAVGAFARRGGATAPSSLRRIFWPSVLLFAFLVVPKVVHVRPHTRAYSGVSGYVADLAVATHQDVLFALGFGALGGLAIFMTHRRARMGCLVQACWLALETLFALYAIASTFVFASLRAPLTYALIYLADDLGAMRSSIAASLTLGMLVALLCGPVAYVMAARVAARKVPAPRGFITAVVLAALAPGLAGNAAYARWWHERPDRRLAKNPHWALACTTFAELTGLTGTNARPFRGGEVRPDDLAEFRAPRAVRRRWNPPAARAT